MILSSQLLNLSQNHLWQNQLYDHLFQQEFLQVSQLEFDYITKIIPTLSPEGLDTSAPYPLYFVHAHPLFKLPWNFYVHSWLSDILDKKSSLYCIDSQWSIGMASVCTTLITISRDSIIPSRITILPLNSTRNKLLSHIS